MAHPRERSGPRRGELNVWLALERPDQPTLPELLVYRPAALFECSIEFRNVRAELIHAREAFYTAWFPEGAEDLAIDWSVPAVDDVSPERLEFEPCASIRPYEGKLRATKRRMDQIQADLVDFLVRRESLQLFYNPTLKWYSRLGEKRDEFLARVTDQLVTELQPKLKELAFRLKLQLEQLREKPLPADVPNDEAENLEVARRRMIAMLQSRMDDTIMSNPQNKRIPLLLSREAVVVPDEFKGIQEELNRIEQDISEKLRALRAESKDHAEDCQEYLIRLQPTDPRIVRRAILWVPV